MIGGLMVNPPGYEDDPDEDEEEILEDDREPEDFDDDICGPLWSPQPRSGE